MTLRILCTGLILSTSFFLNSCSNGKDEGEDPNAPKTNFKEAEKAKMDAANSDKAEELKHEYPKIPDDRILDNGPGTPLYTELKKRYKDEAAELKKQVEASGAKLYFVILTIETGKGAQAGTRYGNPAVKSILEQVGIEYTDLMPIVSAQDQHEITQIPKDGHWSKKGAVFLADHLAPIIKKYYNINSTVTYKASERPETFGDLPPNDDEIMDGSKDMPYHVHANSQGVRMDHDIVFPKKKKRIVLMGDSAFFSPFLNDEYTMAAVLQKMFPDADIMNTSIIGYTIDDYLSLWNDKVKYAEPDMVIVQTNGGDITDLFFSQRNVISRTHKPYYPTPNEAKFYKETYGH
jgi:hypothetical protein